MSIPPSFSTGGFISQQQPEDLSQDRLLSTAPRLDFDGRQCPALCGIPILARLGRGGMGAVYYAINPRIEKEVAIKVLPIDVAESSPDSVQRFVRESRTAARVYSPHLVNVYDANHENGVYYIVMEFVRGVPASRIITPVTELRALEICVAACEGLAAAHAQGIIHRDVKPANILLPFAPGTDEPEWSKAKLADLGLARLEGQSHSLTGGNAFLGTPGFMPPEQIDDAARVGKPADVFALGATLYALLAGRPPFHSEKLIEMLRATADLPHPPIRDLRPELSAPTDALINTALSKKPDQRQPDAGALLAQLKNAIQLLKDPAPTLRASPDSGPAAVRMRNPESKFVHQSPPPPGSARQKDVPTHRVKPADVVKRQENAAPKPVTPAQSTKSNLAKSMFLIIPGVTVCAFLYLMFGPAKPRPVPKNSALAPDINRNTDLKLSNELNRGKLMDSVELREKAAKLIGKSLAQLSDDEWRKATSQALQDYFRGPAGEPAIRQIVALCYPKGRDATFQNITVTSGADSLASEISILYANEFGTEKPLNVFWTFNRQGHISAVAWEKFGVTVKSGEKEVGDFLRDKVLQEVLSLAKLK